MRLNKLRHAGLLAVLAIGGVLFAFGLPGGFLLDDFANLSNLDQVGDGPIFEAIYLTEGPTGFPGRPLSYLSFVLQSASWPDHPGAFKLVNIALHLLNGALVYRLLAKMLALTRRRDATPLALIAAAVWLIHPIQISTVLYVVQRMTELASMGCLAGMLAYLKGRALAGSGRIKHGYFWMSAAVGLGTPLAILAKESGVLLPLFIAVIEFTLLAGVARPPRWKLWAYIFLGVPLLGLAGYLALWHGWLSGYAMRDFSLSQRLYTEAIILWDYLGKIALPRPRAFGIYYDDYPVALPPWSSLATAAAIVAWAAVLVSALRWRRAVPFLSFAVLWFLAGHLLESTIIPLELYFEHRNYLPLLGPALAVAWAARGVWETAAGREMRRLYAALGMLFIVAVGGVSWVEARNWADPVAQAAVWAAERPTSQRAQYALGIAYLYAGHYAQAGQTWQRAQATAPEEAYFDLGRLVLGCIAADVPVPEPRAVARRMANAPLRPVTVDLLDSWALQFEKGSCHRFRTEDALAVTEALLSNPRVSGSKHEWAAWYVKGRLHAVRGELDPAVRALEAANRVLPNLGVMRLQVQWLASAGLYDDALQFIEKDRKDPRWRASQRMLYAGFFDSWKKEVQQAQRDSVAARGR
jgi:tetratricopeptide (TPR) repeat protein